MTAVDFGLLVLRLFLGLQMAAHGAQKLFGWFKGYGPVGTGGYLEGLGFPSGRTMAVLAGLCELGGGLLLALGLLTPLAAGAIAAVMITASFTQHQGKGFFVAEGGFELPALVAVASLAIVFVGTGSFALDRVLRLDLIGWTWGLVACAIAVVGAAAALVARSLAHRGEQRASV